jgi:hypothetical protein
MMVLRMAAILTTCLTFLFCQPFVLPSIAEPLSLPPVLSDVSVNPRVFNPSAGQTTTISYRVSQSCRVALRVFDPDMGLVREMVGESKGGAEAQVFTWDGKDLHGRVVPDEAYFFTLEAYDFSGNLVVHDPSTFSGDEILLREKGRYHRDGRCVPYQLPVAARVKIRAGIGDGGPLLKNIVNGRPRSPGDHCEPWDGLDESGIIPVDSREKQVLNIEAVSLFDQSVITVGNGEYDYFRYAEDLAPQRPKKNSTPFPGSRGCLQGTAPPGTQTAHSGTEILYQPAGGNAREGKRTSSGFRQDTRENTPG